MTWTKIGDEFVDDAADLTDAAVRTHIEALAWSNRRLLDLVVPKRDLRRFAFSEDAEQAVEQLLEAGWWQDLGETWSLTYRPDWQQSREQVEVRRETNLRAQWHRRGDHRKCDPLKCSALSSADKPADSVADNAADPGRDGTGTGQALRERPPTNEYGIGECADCGGFLKLGPDGLCSECVVPAIAAARAAS